MTAHQSNAGATVTEIATGKKKKAGAKKSRSRKIDLPDAAFADVEAISDATGINKLTLTDAIIEKFTEAVAKTAAEVSAQSIAKSILSDRLAKLMG